MAYFNPQQKKPWPIRILNRWGVENDEQAMLITVAGIVIAFVITYFIYVSVLSNDSVPQENLDRALLQEMEEGLGYEE